MEFRWKQFYINKTCKIVKMFFKQTKNKTIFFENIYNLSCVAFRNYRFDKSSDIFSKALKIHVDVWLLRNTSKLEYY